MPIDFPVDPPPRQRRIDIQNTVIYTGFATRGTATSAAGWTIQRVIMAPNGDPEAIEWTDEGVAIWDNRTSETYS